MYLEERYRLKQECLNMHWECQTKLLADSAELKAIKKRIEAHIEDAVKFAEESPEPSPDELRR